MTAYDPHQWRSHLFDIRGSMLREISARVTLCVAWSAIVTVIHQGHWQGLSLTIPSLPHTLIGTALGLLLVFRTNSSYDRFWEGRKLWGSINNECRNLARQTSVLLADDPRLLGETVRWVIAFPYACARHLSRSGDLGPAANELPPASIAAVEASPHGPLAVSRQITLQLNTARDRGLLSDFLFGQLDQLVTQLIDYIGGCERIHSTPLPYAYMVHLRRALILYAFTLPCALLDSFGWMTIPCTLVMTYILFGIEEIGVEIEDPFGEDENDIPMLMLCTGIERACRSMLEKGESELANRKST